MMGKQIYENVKTINCELGDPVVIGEDSFLRDSRLDNYTQINRRNILENVSVGEGSYTGANTVLKHVRLGKYCSVSWNVSATGNMHDYRRITSHPFTYLKSFGIVEKNTPLNHQTINIGNDVWIGSNVCILAGVSIGDGAVIGAGGVVTKDVPPYAIIVGNPGRVLKYRYEEDIISLLEEAKWWDWSQSTIKDNIGLFNVKMTMGIAEKILKISKGE